MLIVLSTISTLLIAAWLILLCRVSDDDRKLAVYAKILDSYAAIRKLVSKDKESREKLSAYSGRMTALVASYLHKNTHKQIEKHNREIECLRSGRENSLNLLIMPGYVLQREIEAIGKSGFRKDILSKCLELYGKKNAPYKTSQLLAQMLSYPIIGIAATLILGVILLGIDSTTAGMGIIGVGTVLVLILAYALYDELGDAVKKRQKAISRQFPSAISKLALLTTSGMIMDRAWKETAHSQETELYMEMRSTSKELDNLVSPELAYGNFINRCNTKETAKLASAIMQNMTKGNSEIGRLLRDMAREVWQERRHTAKRDAEKANSKLMIPTMLLFLTILVMLMVPIAMNFSGL